jgi:hypothetical protein
MLLVACPRTVVYTSAGAERRRQMCSADSNGDSNRAMQVRTLTGPYDYRAGIHRRSWTQGDGARLATDQKVGGSSPSERATGPPR